MTDTQIRHSRRQLLGMTGAALFWPVIGRAAPFAALQGRAFGTGWRLAVSGGANPEVLRPDLETLFDEVDRQMSPWRIDSDISRVNRGRAGEHPIPADLSQVTESALRIARDSKGCFDPTVGPLVAHWGFGPIEGSEKPDWRAVTVGRGGLVKARADLTLDLCGIAKGWALDRAMGLLRDAGVESALFDLGGELSAIGAHPSGREWQVAVEHPWRAAPAPAILRLAAGRAVATSGIRSQSYRLGERNYGHIIDPSAAAPASGRLRSVTVLGYDAVTADGWATALFAAGEMRGPALARDNGLDALFLVEDRAEVRQIKTGRISEVML